MAKKIEVFTAGCEFCDSAVSLVNDNAKKDDAVIIYNLNDNNKKKDYQKVADSYGVKSIPAIVVNGNLLDCCKSNGVSKDLLLNALS